MGQPLRSSRRVGHIRGCEGETRQAQPSPLPRDSWCESLIGQPSPAVVIQRITFSKSQNLARGHFIENADIWTEFVAWRDRHTSTGAKVRIQWHPGHLERRNKKADWSAEDRAIFVADQLAEAAHEEPAAPRSLTAWSHQATWKLHWRGEELAGSVTKRLEEIVRTEQLAAYIQSVGIGPGTDTE